MDATVRGIARRYVWVPATLAALVTFAVGCMTESAPDRGENRPNILFIMSDDHSERAISAYGSTLINTPNIDRLADEGMIFRESFVANSICGPSRAIMLTGKHSHKNGFRNNYDQFDGSQPTYPLYLRQASRLDLTTGKCCAGRGSTIHRSS